MTISPSYPFNLQNGTTADATQVMADFLQIQNDVNANAAHNGINSDITEISGLTVPLSILQGGTGATTSSAARTALGLGTAAVENLAAAIVDDGAGNLTIKNASIVSAMLTALVLVNGTTATTQSAGDATTKVATTQFINNLVTSPIALVNGTTAVTQAIGDSTTDVATTAFANPAQLKTANGYVKLPGGVIIQWGNDTTTTNNPQTTTFPIAFPTACWAAFSIVNNATDGKRCSSLGGVSSTQVIVYTGEGGIGVEPFDYFWCAIGD